MASQNRRQFFRTLGLGATALLWPHVLRAAEGQRPPNIVFILADDMGYGDLACQNPASKIPTPNLDRLAAQGMRFTDAHSPSAVCTPTRYGVLTGRYCWRSSLKRGVLGGFSPALIEPGRITVASMLKDRGYATACIGKWHLGMDWAMQAADAANARGAAAKEERIDFTRPVTNGPCTRGFDYFFGISASLDMPPYVFIENDRVVAQPTARQEKQGYVRVGPKDPAFRFEDVLPQLTARAMEFIARQSPDRPFFLYFPLNAPHTPIAPAQQFKGRGKAGDYGDFVAQVDWTVAQVMRALEDRGLAGNTLLFFTSDNGPESLAYARIQEHGHYSMGDLRGVKRDTWEGGHRVPFIARWPGKIRPGSTSMQLICLTDLMATAAAVSGAQLKDDAGEDSFNLLPALLGAVGKTVRESVVHHSGSGRFAIRRQNWVLIDAPSGDDNREPAWLKKQRDYPPNNAASGEMYDLSQDISERRNLYAEQPDRVQELKSLLEKYKRSGRSRGI